jgi:hypothetical protein
MRRRLPLDRVPKGTGDQLANLELRLKTVQRNGYAAFRPIQLKALRRAIEYFAANAVEGEAQR